MGCFGEKKSKVIDISGGNPDDSDSDIDKDFATSTSCHGVSYWYTSEARLLKAIWILLVLGMTGMLAYQVSLRFLAYRAFDTSTDISEDFVSYLDFPAVTICAFNRYFFQGTNEQLAAVYALNRLTTSSKFAYDTKNSGKPQSSTIGGLVANYTDFNITEFSHQYGYSIGRDNLIECKFKTSPCNSSHFKTITTSLGQCHTFNEGDEAWTQNIPGAGNGLSIVLDIKQYLYTEEPLEGLDSSGIKLQIHPWYEEPDVETYGVAVPVGQKAFIEMTRVDNRLMYEPWGRCEPSNENLKYFSTYSLNNCINECYTDEVIAQCGCRLYTQYWAIQERECTLQEMFDCAIEHFVAIKQNYSASDCNCTIPCSFTSYQVSVTYATYPGYTTRQFLQQLLNLSEDTVEDNLLKFEIYFGSMSYRTFSQSKKVDESGLLSDVGGQLGLWVGMSFITLAEFLQYFIRRTVHCLKRIGLSLIHI